MPSNEELSPEEYIQVNQAIFSLRNIYEARLRNETGDGEHDLSVAEFGLLMVVGRHERVMARTLVRLMDITPATVSQYVAKLRKRGLIEQVRDEIDRRAWWLFLSEEGRRTYEGAFEGTVLYTKDMLSVLGPEDRRTFHRLLLSAARGNGYDWI